MPPAAGGHSARHLPRKGAPLNRELIVFSLLFALAAFAEDGPAADPFAALDRKAAQPSGIAIAFDDAIFGDGMAGSLRLKVPLGFLGGYVGFHTGPIFLLHNTETSPVMYAGGRFYIFGQSPILPNLIRLYGGLGVQVLTSLNNPGTISVLPYGQDGIEFFMLRWMSFYLEIGITPLL